MAIDAFDTNYIGHLETQLADARRTLATLTAAGIVVGEDGAARWHGLTGEQVEAMKTTCNEVFGLVLRSDWKGKDARRAVMLLESVLTAAAGRGADGEAGE